MEYKKYYGALEAVLFASGEPVPAVRIAEVLEIDSSTMDRLMEEFTAQYQAMERGLKVVKLDDSYQLCTKPEYAAPVKKTLEIKRNIPLSQAAMETLAIIAYNEPVTKGFIEQVRGVDSAQTVNNLVDKGLAEEAGRLDVPGRPITYRTTDNFLRSFQLSSLKELPSLPDENGQVMLEEIVAEQEENSLDDVPQTD